LGKPGKKEMTPAAKTLDGLVGSYGQRNEPFEISREGNGLVAKFRGVRFVLYAESATKFFAKSLDLQMEFEVGADGVAGRVTYSVGEGANVAVRLR
jgi:hypothetical protein